MNRFCHGPKWLAGYVALAVAVSSAVAQNVTNSSAPWSPPIPPNIVLLPPSPVGYFRKLLAMTPQERESLLAKKSPAIRERILAKVNEYAALDPDERELRLRATDLRWYMTLLMHAPQDQREAEMASVPDDLRDPLQFRLLQWEMLPPNLQQEFLDNERVLGYFSEVDVTRNGAESPKPSDADQSRWNALPANERQGMIAQFNQFFELSADEKQKALGQLPEAERKQMEKTLQQFEKLPQPERVACIHAFGKFAGMNKAERAEFLQNAQRWSKMTPTERKAWRDLVAHVPQWPPLPPADMTPPLPPLPEDAHAFAATNRG